MTPIREQLLREFLISNKDLVMSENWQELLDKAYKQDFRVLKELVKILWKEDIPELLIYTSFLEVPTMHVGVNLNDLLRKQGKVLHLDNCVETVYFDDGIEIIGSAESLTPISATNIYYRKVSIPVTCTWLRMLLPIRVGLEYRGTKDQFEKIKHQVYGHSVQCIDGTLYT